ncbi:unnamed protein product [Lepeophtheirus salmonis]|uniref:(salmon louse) hypothetical protein n=1 Tax=Lepeophtheirus salmonis TaxID=72036 RepID=A0A7R8CWY7_LEPSM|nr:unnamed protein product [Lepeophtheirus salmonis]CAF2956443.1 unnamed protein product [Lepeophtheirus salmonis]
MYPQSGFPRVPLKGRIDVPYPSLNTLKTGVELEWDIRGLPTKGLFWFQEKVGPVCGNNYTDQRSMEDPSEGDRECLLNSLSVDVGAIMDEHHSRRLSKLKKVGN